MSDGNWRAYIALAGIGLALSSCAPFEPLPERRLDAPECGYAEAQEARQRAHGAENEARYAGAPRARLRELRHAIESADQRKEESAECEQHAREWSDLSAQWQSARAAVSMQDTARAQTYLAVGEIVALLFTIVVGVWAIIEGRVASQAALAIARASIVHERRPWMTLEVSHGRQVKFSKDDEGGWDCWTISAKMNAQNIGLTPALFVNLAAFVSARELTADEARAAGIDIATYGEGGVAFAEEIARGYGISTRPRGAEGAHVFPQEKFGDDLGDWPLDVYVRHLPKAGPVLLYYFVFYRVAFDSEVRSTAQMFELYLGKEITDSAADFELTDDTLERDFIACPPPT